MRRLPRPGKDASPFARDASGGRSRAESLAARTAVRKLVSYRRVFPRHRRAPASTNARLSDNEHTHPAHRTPDWEPSRSHLRAVRARGLPHQRIEPVLQAGHRRPGAHDPPAPRPGNEPLCGARLSRLRADWQRLDRRQRLRCRGAVRAHFQQSQQQADALGARRAGGFSGAVGA